MSKNTDTAKAIRTLAARASEQGSPMHVEAMQLADELDRQAAIDDKRYDDSCKLQDIGKSAFESIAEMVAALECDYDRLEELRDAGITKVTAPSAWASYLINGDATGIDDREQEEADAMVAHIGLGSPTDCDDAGFVSNPDYGAYGGDCQTYTFYDGTVFDETTREEFKELTAAAGECKDREEAEQRIMEDPLSLQVRGDWHSPGEEDSTAAEFELLLGTGGPAVRIIGELSSGEPTRARLQTQDWFLPWTDYIGGDSETLLTYCRCFYFGEG